MFGKIGRGQRLKPQSASGPSTSAATEQMVSASRAREQQNAAVKKAVEAALREYAQKDKERQVANIQAAEVAFVTLAVKFVEDFAAPVLRGEASMSSSDLYRWLNDFQLGLERLKVFAAIAAMDTELDSDMLALARGESVGES